MITREPHCKRVPSQGRRLHAKHACQRFRRRSDTASFHPSKSSRHSHTRCPLHPYSYSVTAGTGALSSHCSVPRHKTNQDFNPLESASCRAHKKSRPFWGGFVAGNFRVILGTSNSPDPNQAVGAGAAVSAATLKSTHSKIAVSYTHLRAHET